MLRSSVADAAPDLAPPAILRDTLIGVIVGGIMSFVAFAAVFGLGGSVRLVELGFDSFPQTFMATLMSSLMPGLAAAKRYASSRAAVVRRAVATAFVAMITLGGAGWAVCAFIGGSVPSRTALIFKIGYGGCLAILATPPAVRAACRKPSGPAST